ncbi:MAG: hypothetical protein JKY98_07790 [Gammaproteobacteria bacterium]|nr:hypothetical protein [Gammaproteobacteria bacterium]
MKPDTIDFSITNFSTSCISRRSLLKALPALLISPRLFAQPSIPSVPALKLHSFGLRVTDIEQSLRFYQGLFGSPIQARQGDTVVLRMGDGPFFYSLRPIVSDEQPGITQIGVSVGEFDVDRIRSLLQAHGVSLGSQPGAGQSGFTMAMKSWIGTRRPERGGSTAGTRELFFADRDGIVYQLNDSSYCGGTGEQGNTCEALQASPHSGLITLRELNHFTNRVHNRDISNQFHRQLFGLDFQASQGPRAPVIGVGDGYQFLMYVGGTGEGQPQQAGRIDHVCMGMDNFDVDAVQALLNNYGLRPRQDPSKVSPLEHYVSMRMPNRGGAEGGTPELYFSDPDGIRIQLQDPSYCGGTGFLGDDCSASV